MQQGSPLSTSTHLTPSSRLDDTLWNWPLPVRWGIGLLMGLLAAYGVDAMGLTNIEGVEPLLVFIVACGVIVAGLSFLPHVMASSGVALQIRAVLPYAILQVLYVWGGIGGALVDLKLDKLAMLVGFVGFGLLLFQHFWALWQQPVLQRLLIYLAINVVFLFVHGSDFSLGGASAGYPVVATMSGAADTAAKTIIFVLALGVVSATMCGYGVFLWGNPTTRNQLRVLFQWVALIIMASGVVYGGLSVLGGFGKVSPGHSTLVVVLFIWLMGIASSWSAFVTDDEEMPVPPLSERLMLFWFPKIVLPTIGLTALVMLLGMNKTSLVGLAVSLLVLEGLNWRYGSRQKLTLLRVIPEPIRTNPVWWVVIAAVFGLGLMASGMMDVIGEKITYFAEGFESMSTLRVRTGNWFYFLKEWEDTLGFANLLVGYGLGASRDAIFYISAMREGGHINLVQTLHNHYLETFYDYGLLALFYWLSWLGLLYRFLWATMRENLTPGLRMLVHMAIATMVFMMFYLLLDGFRVHVAIICFAYWGLVYGAIHRYQWIMNEPEAWSAVKHQPSQPVNPN